MKMAILFLIYLPILGSAACAPDRYEMMEPDNFCEQSQEFPGYYLNEFRELLSEKERFILPDRYEDYIDFLDELSDMITSKKKVYKDKLLAN